MEPLYKLLETILSNENLDNLIQTSTSAEILNYLLGVKHQRLIKGQCEKLDFSLNCIFDNILNVDLANEILKTALLVAEHSHTHLSKTISYCLKKLHLNDDFSEVYYALNLFNVVLEYYKEEHKEFDCDFSNLHDDILAVLNKSSKPHVTFVLINIFPNYLGVINKDNSNTFLMKMFEFVQKTKRLEILCVCYDLFVLNDNFNLLIHDDFWFLLRDCILDQHYYLRKQALYLLSKSLDAALKPDNSSFIPKYLKVKNSQEIEKIWRNYLILLDVSNEKQLHIVQPSLHKFTLIKDLNFLWRDCLYKIFLNHSQNSVVCYVVIFILQNETEWQNFSKIIYEVLCAINRNEYNTDSIRVFKEINTFCKKLDNNQFETLLRESLVVPWIPAGIWGFYSHIFIQPIHFQISVQLLQEIIKNLKAIPHRFIRNGCTKIVSKFFLENYEVDDTEDLLRVLRLIRNCHEIFEISQFENFIRRNEDKIQPELCDEFLTSIANSDCDNVHIFEITTKMLQLLKLRIGSRIGTPSPKIDLVYLTLSYHFDETDVENYLINRIDSIRNSENITPLLLLCKKLNSVKLSEKAFDILLEKSIDKYNTQQRIIAFTMLKEENCRSVINFWKDHFLETDERITQHFVEILLKNSAKRDTPEFFTILENVLDSQSKATITILENVAPILKHMEQMTTLHFIERCFDELLVLIKSNGCSKITTIKFLSQLFQKGLLENYEFCNRLLTFSQRLLDIANNFNSVAYILSEKLSEAIEHDPQNGSVFIPLIVNLILHGIIINKNERVEYHVCQEIGVIFPNENNPNVEAVSVRLSALDSMLILVNECLSENVTDKFVSLLTETYLKYFSKRYFPDSQVKLLCEAIINDCNIAVSFAICHLFLMIHLEKLRILQALMLLHKTIDDKASLINLITESFLLETHQPSVKHLMQWLLISLARKDSQDFIQIVCEKLKSIDHNRPSTVSGLIPVLFHLIVSEDVARWDQIIAILLPYTMGAQFKLRIFSQVALIKIYEEALTREFGTFLQKYKFLYDSLKQVIDATINAHYDIRNIYHEFLDYFSLENYDCSTIFYTIPKNNEVSEIEWEDLTRVSVLKQFRHMKFNHEEEKQKSTNTEVQMKYNENIQKKITPWKQMLDSDNSNDFMLVTSLIEKPANLGGLSRTCEVFGIKKMVMRTSKITSDKEFKSLSMSSENWVDITEVKSENLQKFILDIKKEGFSVIAAEQTSDSVKIDKFQFPKRTILVLGNEKEGIPSDLIHLMDSCIEIPQFGMVRSLNVHVAGAIVMWEYCKQHRL